MPSSTSSSSANERLPRGPWLRMWTLVVALVAGSLGALEVAARQRGILPTCEDSPTLWALARSRLPKWDPRAVAFLGSSQAQLGLSPAAFAAATGITPAQLAMDGTSAHGFLDHLARDESFCGLAMVEIAFLFDGRALHERRARTYAELYRAFRASPSSQVDIRLRLMWSSAAAVAAPEMSLRSFARAAAQGRWPERFYVTTRPDRTRLADYHVADLDRLRRQPAVGADSERVYLTGAALADRLAQLSDAVRRIEQRGGRVVFLQMPASAENLKRAEDLMPRTKYWDALLAATGAIGIRADEEPALSRFECPDGQHLDYRGAGAFTTALVHVLKQRLKAARDHRLDPRP